MKTTDQQKPEITEFLPVRFVQPEEHISRGIILSGVLDGTASYEAITPYTDGDAGNLDSSIDYDPNADQRLDKFDALEEGYDAIDSCDVKTTDNQTSEKKE